MPSRSARWHGLLDNLRSVSNSNLRDASAPDARPRHTVRTQVFPMPATAGGAQFRPAWSLHNVGRCSGKSSWGTLRVIPSLRPGHALVSSTIRSDRMATGCVRRCMRVLFAHGVAHVRLATEADILKRSGFNISRRRETVCQGLIDPPGLVNRGLRVYCLYDRNGGMPRNVCFQQGAQMWHSR